MIMQTLLQTAFLAVAAKAASLTARTPDGTDGFRLRANMLYPDSPGNGPNVHDQELNYVSGDECQAIVVLLPEDQGTTFYANNNTIGVYFDNTSPQFAGMVVPWRGPAMVPSGRPVELRCSDGTPGLTLNDKGVYYPGEMGPDFNGAFMVCQEGDDAILSFFGWGQRPIWGCSVIQLLPVYKALGIHRL